MRKIIYVVVLFIFYTTLLQARTTCSQFKDHAQAQRYYEAGKRGYKSLDRDKDGEACECLKGGSSYGKSVCRRWRKKHGK